MPYKDYAKIIAKFLSTPSARRATFSGRAPATYRTRFLSTPSARRATERRRRSLLEPDHFYPRPPRGGRHSLFRMHYRKVPISIHALREEGDGVPNIDIPSGKKFLSTPSARRATYLRGPVLGSCMHFYPRPPRGGRPHDAFCLVKPSNISIHALREEGDFEILAVSLHLVISIHALREEGDGRLLLHQRCSPIFLSTPSARRATAQPSKSGNPQGYFYPRPPRGGRRRRAAV